MQFALRNLEVSYQNFFKKRAKFPRFHAKKNRQCIKIPQAFKIKNNNLYIPKLKSGIEIIIHQSLPENQICCFISKTPSGKYYASFLCEINIESLESSNKIIGIDLGIKSLLISSTGENIENKKYFSKLEIKLAYEQKQLNKKKNGSKQKEKQRKVVARINEKNCQSKKKLPS